MLFLKFASNQSPESICDDVIAFLDKVKMEASTGDVAVKQTPKDGLTQLGAEKSALPSAVNPPPAENSTQPAV